MVGLEKSKAAAGETSQSASALTLEDIHKLYDQCLKSKDLTTLECRWGVVRYTIYLLAWLILLCIEEATNLEFESIDFHPGEHMCCYFEVRLRTRKSAQTGVSLTWKLYANDSDIRICPTSSIISRALTKDMQTLGY
ncbi:hypothetical protein K439DRAFT_1612755 [Ramaria rubella]|nr:hypothetical protein K439DRAFT_1612755 [Ramaria rubella]